MRANIIVGIVVALAIIIAVPLLLIWSVNTLFQTGIDYTFWTWLAALLLGGVIGGSKIK